ncbi:hypothetical protein J1N35_003678 [Gossypium stocksii]|uniref:Uncharacterized protein n=1 Tax=Gossypium stocksii TaxID=47602 RepID=A0A9D3WC82_9ROSI|nr:hypothetical protein J1N35_003678 [Gossypium stocksii]
MIELEGPLSKSDAVNRELVSLEREFATLSKNNMIDPFGLYLYCLVLKEKGNENLAGKVSWNPCTVTLGRWSLKRNKNGEGKGEKEEYFVGACDESKSPEISSTATVAKRESVSM